MLKNIIDFINNLIMYYVFIYAVIFFVSTIFSMINLNDHILRKRYRNNIRIKNKANYIPVSVLIPAYNEETTVIDCIKSILNLDYREFEIVVINDGSTDNTEKVIIEEFNLTKVARPIRRLVDCKTELSIYEGGNNIKITLINKENGGKADSLNMGVNAAKYPFVACIDADSVLKKDSLMEIVTPFIENDKTIAAGGNIKVSNQVVIEDGEVKEVGDPKKWIVILQLIEYYRVFLTTRVWMNKFNGNLIISGAFGLFKKQAIVNVGGYNPNSIGEDMELVVKLHSFYRKNKIPYSIQYVPEAICWSQVPETIGDLKSQRRRWHMGLMESMFEHKYIFMNPTYGIVGVFSFLYYVIYELFSCVIEVFGLLFMFIAYEYGYMNMDFFITFFLIYFMYTSVVSIASIILEGYMFDTMLTLKTKVKLILFSFIEPFGYRQLCSFFRILGIFKFRSRKHAWDKIGRIDYKEIKDRNDKTA